LKGGDEDIEKYRQQMADAGMLMDAN